MFKKVLAICVVMVLIFSVLIFSVGCGRTSRIFIEDDFELRISVNTTSLTMKDGFAQVEMLVTLRNNSGYSLIIYHWAHFLTPFVNDEPIENPHITGQPISRRFEKDEVIIKTRLVGFWETGAHNLSVMALFALKWGTRYESLLGWFTSNVIEISVL